MGQCCSCCQEEERGGRWERGNEEEARSLVRHEGDYQKDCATDIGERSVVSSQQSGQPSSMNGHAVSTRERVGKDSPDALIPVRNGAVNLQKEQELSNVVSGGWIQPASSRPSSPVHSQKGLEVVEELSKAYRWREQFEHPSPEFLALMDRLYMECQLHLTTLSSQGDLESRREADVIVSEMVALRNYWGPQLLPSSTCNAFVRERIPLTLGADQRQFRIDCAQFFEPVPFYGNQQNSCPGELMKLYRFSVYNIAKNEVVLRYFLERSNITQFYHVLCFMDNNCHGQVNPYGTGPPSYWEVRKNMLDDLNMRLLNSVSPDSHPLPKPLALTVFAADRVGN